MGMGGYPGRFFKFEAVYDPPTPFWWEGKRVTLCVVCIDMYVNCVPSRVVCIIHARSCFYFGFDPSFFFFR